MGAFMKILLVFFILFSTNVLANNESVEPMLSKNISNFKILKIDQDSIYEKLGLKEGDIIKKVNGQIVTSPKNAKQLFSKIKQLNKFEITIERNGKEEVLRYSIK